MLPMRFRATNVHPVAKCCLAQKPCGKLSYLGLLLDGRSRLHNQVGSSLLEFRMHLGVVAAESDGHSKLRWV